MSDPSIREADFPRDLATVRALFEEYAAGLGVDLCLQGFAAELAGLPGAYAAPAGGVWLASVGAEIAGCVALRPLDARRAEMKRLYVRPGLRKTGAGRALTAHVVRAARERGHGQLCLDTLRSMSAAIALYRSMGFADIEPYHGNPVSGALFLGKDLAPRDSGDCVVRRLVPEDAAALAILRREALEQSPLAFSSTPDSPRASASFLAQALADRDEQAIFGCFEAGVLVGMVGILRESGIKQRHRAGIWGMYVTSGMRGKGSGRALLDAARDHARAWPEVAHVHLSVSDAAVAANRLYESAGFRTWGREPRALQWEGRFVDEIHMVLEW